MQVFSNKHILLGVTGSIAAYKSAEVVRLLRQLGANVQVVMTQDAQEFITPLTLQALSGTPVHTQLLNHDSEASMSHITLAKWADILLVAPASANVIAKFSNGLADDLLSTLYLATDAKVILAPAMNQAMWQHPATQHNKSVLLQRGVTLLGPEIGSQACGDFGPGRMVEPTAIINHLNECLSAKLFLNKTILITSGPTREPIDSVRYLSNYSSGKMGLALAEAAHLAGANVIFISGPSEVKSDFTFQNISVNTAEEMYQSVMNHIKWADIFISAAAVSDFRYKKPHSHKIKKEDFPKTLEFIPNEDIAAHVGKLPHKPYVIGFAAETNDLVLNAQSKLQNKNLNMIIANEVGNQTSGFMSDNNAVTVITPHFEKSFALRPKKQLASELITLIAQEYQLQTSRCKEVDKGII